MSNPAFQLAAASAAVTALLGTAPVRFFPFGEAMDGTETPYAVYQLAFGSPQNLLNEVPHEDSFGVQVDAYADTGAEAHEVADALRDAFERDGYVVAFNGEWRETDTRLYRSSFTVEFIKARSEL